MALLNTRLFLDALTPAGDFVVFVTGTQTDVEDQVVGRPYGVGTLYAPVAGGATQMQVACEENGQYGSLQPFRVGDVLRVSDRPSTGGAGNEEWTTVTGITYGVNFATVDVSPALNNDYATTNDPGVERPGTGQRGGRLVRTGRIEHGGCSTGPP